MLISGLTSLLMRPPKMEPVAKISAPPPAQATAEDQVEATSLPMELFEDVVSFVEPASLPSFSQTSKACRVLAHARYRGLLKPEFSSVADPAGAYADPSKREDFCVPTDRKGKDHLTRLGIGGLLTCQAIKNRETSIARAIAIKNEMLRMGTGSRIRFCDACMRDPIIIDCVIAGRVDSWGSPFARHDPDALSSVFRFNWIVGSGHEELLSRLQLPVVLKHIYASHLCIQDIMELSLGDLAELDSSILEKNPDAVRLLRLRRMRNLLSYSFRAAT